MSLLDRLRPKWQSADADVRAEAVRELDKDETELLTAVALQDSDPRVRRIAVKKIDSPRLLLEIADKEEDGRLRAFARKRARQILVQIACDDRDVEESKRAFALLSDARDRVAVLERARFAELRTAAFETLTEDDDLLELVSRAKDADLRARALEKIRSPHALKKVVIEEASGDLGFMAVAKIDDAGVLESLYEQHTLPRAIRRHALAKLEQLVPADHPIKVKARQEQFLEICLKAEFLADARTTSETDALRKSWAEVEAGGAADAEIAERYRAALDRLEAIELARRKAEAEPPSASADEPAIVPPAADERTPRLVQIVERVESLEGDALASGIDEARAEWEDIAGAGGPIGPALDARFRATLEAASARRIRFDERAALLQELSAILERAEAASKRTDLSASLKEFRAVEGDWKRAEKDWGEIPAEFSSRYRSAAEHLSAREGEARRSREEAEHATLVELESRIALMDVLAAQEELSIRDAERALREAQDFLKSMGKLPPGANRKKARARLAEARERLFKRTQDSRELDEWKRWANVDVQQSLIERIEKLRSSNDLPKVAKEMRKIHEEWKTAGATTPDKAEELWQRYKSIRDELKARCDAFFEKQAGERVENHKQKELLCERVEALKGSQDWKGTAEAIKEIQIQWKKIGPVPQESSDAIWKRFRAACDHFFERRKKNFEQVRTERDENLAKKVALCEQAESMQDSTDWHATADSLKRLQADWREIGAVPRKKSDEVWNRLRAACDHFFDRFKRRDEVENEERDKKRTSLVEELERLSSPPPGERGEAASVATRVQEIWTEWKKLGPPSEAKRELPDRFENAVGAIVLAAPESFAGGELDPATSRKKREKLCHRLESIVGELDDGKPAEEPLADLAQRLKDALASNTIGGGQRRAPRLDWRGALDEVERLKANWWRSAPVPGDEGRALVERFDNACRSFRDLRPPGRSSTRRPQHLDSRS